MRLAATVQKDDEALTWVLNLLSSLYPSAWVIDKRQIRALLILGNVLR
jgi:hypothetical protein